MQIQNPILPGFYPDPSICRVGEDYYMICSSFELFPGVPVFHSKDLMNWLQIGHAFGESNGFHVHANVVANGVMAPTIRYHDGMFYIIVANFGDQGNCTVVAENPAGPWSEPIWLEDVHDIDASLFFDDDGKGYVVYPSTTTKTDGSKTREIYLVPFDHSTRQAVGEGRAIWNCALRGAASPEAPHIYKFGDYYYLMIAEGGTEHYHAVTVARSKELFGWYEGNPANPVMTHRHLGYEADIVNVGHADLVATPEGQWFAVLLASRTIGGYHKNLGRETFLCPVTWERDWPVFSGDTGKIEWIYDLGEVTIQPEDDIDDTISEGEEVLGSFSLDFAEQKAGLRWCYWGTPYESKVYYDSEGMHLKCMKRHFTRGLQGIKIGQPEMSKDDTVGFYGIRQTAVNFNLKVEVDFYPKANEAAGLVVLQASNHHIRYERICNEEGEQLLRLVQVTTKMNHAPHIPGFESVTEEEVLAEVAYLHPVITLGVEAKGQAYTFYYMDSNEERYLLIEDVDGRMINPEVVGGMVGTMLGVFATANDQMSDNTLIVKKVDYKI